MSIFNFGAKTPLKILFVASEAAPFAHVGGLGGVMYSLPRALKNLGHDARVMIPRYLNINADKFSLRTLEEGIDVSGKSGEPVICNVKIYEPSRDEGRTPVTTYFLENQEYYEKRANIYGYSDDAVRWAILSRGAIEFVRRHKEWRPDVIVAADWQTGLIPNYLKTEYQNSGIVRDIAVLFSIHNLYFQGTFDHHFVNDMDYDAGHATIPGFFDPKLLKINFMRRGIMYADAINTVSPTYAREITTPEYGELLDELLRERRSRLYGVLNGIDYEDWNPEEDKSIDFNFSASSLGNRSKNKAILQHKFALPEDESAFILGIVSRLTEQKGFDLLLDSIDPLLSNFNVQLIVVGSGDGKYMGFFEDLRKKFPKQVATHLSFDEVLPRMVYAGSDAILAPSRYEPCGLTQMEAMRYGAIPIVRRTGGLADSVEDYNPAKQTGTGFVFDSYDSFALYGAVARAIETHKYKNLWIDLQRRAMKADFSWEMSAQKYVKLFEKAIDIHKREAEDK